MSRLVLLTGATGYVGARLLTELVRQERRVRCLARWPENLHGRVPEGVEVVYGDACDAASLASALAGVEAAFYLVHALGTSADAAEFDRRAARSFGAAARAAGMRRIVYFGGFGPPPSAGAPRGRVDQDVGGALRASGVPVVELRASVIIGPGSLSFEMIRALVERMPVIVAPRWLRTPVRPIFSGDVLAYLLAALDLPASESRIFAIGGRDIVSYAELMREYARQRGLRRWIIPVSVDAPRVSSLWLATVTPLYARIGRRLIDSVRHPMVGDDAALQEFAVQPVGVPEAIARAMRSEEVGQARTSWWYGVAAEDTIRRWGGARLGNRLVDSRVVAVPATPAAAIERIGGDRGWYSTRWLWQLRGWMDLLVGGVGMRRGRRPDHFDPPDGDLRSAGAGGPALLVCVVAVAPVGLRPDGARPGARGAEAGGSRRHGAAISLTPRRPAGILGPIRVERASMATARRHPTKRAITAGSFFPLGATVQPEGVNFAIYSRDASEVHLLLFDRPDGPPTDVIQIANRTKFVWHTFVAGVKPGQLYGYKVLGDFDPSAGKRFNGAKLLIDPYAKALSHKASNRDNLLLAYDSTSADRDLSLDTRDNSHLVPKAIVVDDAFDWRGDVSPAIPFERLIIYEVHARGFTAHPSSRVKSPGTYLGFAERIPYLKSLGVTAVELLPVHECHVEDFLRGKGLTNYWGYNTLGFFAPESAYSTGKKPGCQVAEFKTMVRKLHQAGIEVILDVVYNHTAEGNELGPTLSLRGIDNRTYYCLTGGPGDPGRYYANYTGCGNSLNLTNPAVIRLVLDSLRYWAETMHVDGFRFDLASVLGRDPSGFDGSAAFFHAVAQDPALQRVKLIAEPWDLGTYQVGNFPVDWSEWNGRFRDAARRFVKGDGGWVRDMGARLTGSADLYGDDGRSAYNSVNFVTCHDGFTLWDLVSYDHKHNEANLEDNRDGSDDTTSWNCGAEGETDDPGINRLRQQLARNHLCVLLFSAGTPMLLGGDEFLRTQRGNNNAYCQDNELSHFDWDRVGANRGMVEFVRKAIALTRRCTILQRRRFLLGRDLDSDSVSDITWYGADLDRPAWDDPELRTLCYQLDGSEEPSDLGDYRLFLILNSDHRVRSVRLPPLPEPQCWRRILDTSLEPGEEWCDPGREVAIVPEDRYVANPRSVVVLIGN